MSGQEQTQAAPTTTTTEEASLLDQVIVNTKGTSKDRVPEMLKALIASASDAGVKWEKSVDRTIQKMVAEIDKWVSLQLSEVMHHSKFAKLEGSVRGLNYLVMNSETSNTLQIKLLNASKKDLAKDLERAAEFDQSTLFKKIYENEFGQAGGEPFGALVHDEEYSNHPDDVTMLRNMSGVAASALCPIISAVSPTTFGFEDFTELAKPRDLEKIFSGPDHTAWNSFRNSDDSRYMVMTMPRVLSRLPYGKATKPIEEFAFEEVTPDREAKHTDYCWSNAAYSMATKLTNAFSQYGWCTAIRGAENGGAVENLPLHVFTSDDGGRDVKCPTEIAITDRREAELSKLGFLPLCFFKNQDKAVFFGAQTAQKPKQYEGKDGPAATANAAISARLPYIMASSRIGHYLKVIGRDRIGSFMERSDCEGWLQDWIANYVCADAKPTADQKARFPLAQAQIQVEEIPGSPGAYRAIAHLRPFLQMEELTASLRMVANIPVKA